MTVARRLRCRSRACPLDGRLLLDDDADGGQQQFQYRTANYFYMLGMVAEPVIYLVVWTTIADQHGGSVDGLTAGYFAAYYIVWTLVRNMNIVFGAPYGWEHRIREGELNRDLLRPLLPLHYDIA